MPKSGVYRLRLSKKTGKGRKGKACKGKKASK